MNKNPKTQPTLEQRAEAFTNNEMERRTQATIFDAKGELRPGAASLAHTGQISLGEYLNLARVPFPPEPAGSDYCTHLARLAEYIGTLPGPFGGVVGGPLDAMDQKALHAVSMLHTVGQGHMGEGTELRGLVGYAERSAAYAEKFLRGEGAVNTIWAKPEMRETVCKLIRFHTDEREIKLDKRLQVFSDAMRFELCRLSPNTAEGMALLKREWQPQLFNCGWSRNSENARAYMASRGWR